MADDDVQACEAIPENWYWFRSRCGSDRDCVPADNFVPFKLGYCNAIAWCRTNPGTKRFVEVWDKDNSRKLFVLTERNSTREKADRCALWVKGGAVSAVTFNNSDSVFTIQIPGIQDILSVPSLVSSELRRQRAERTLRANSGMPDGLKWVPKLLNKLDDAQDMLYVGLIVGAYLAKVAGARIFPGLGILLTINDLLNFTG